MASKPHAMRLLFTFVFLLLLPSSYAWGTLGHRTTAYLASLYFTPRADFLVTTLLNGQELTEAALFPDKIRYIPEFRYTAGWHYIDAQDKPPAYCGINMTRDCVEANGGCVVSAIANHTERVLNESLPHWQRGQSMRFVLHFFGDVHQPLHTENESRGGNEIPVVFDGRKANLHGVWDTLIPNKRAQSTHDNETESARAWAHKLYQPDVDLRAECLHDAADCALLWAGEANQYVCKYVLKDDVEGLEGKDLAGEYFEGAVPIIDEMVQKGGRRLAAWVNAMAEKLHGHDSEGTDLYVQDL